MNSSQHDKLTASKINPVKLEKPYPRLKTWYLLVLKHKARLKYVHQGKHVSKNERLAFFNFAPGLYV